jgi:hypothetical protein
VGLFGANDMNKYFTNKEFRIGFDAAALCESCDKSKSKDWIEGWNYYQDKITASETACWF